MTIDKAIEKLKIQKQEWDRHIYDLSNSAALRMGIKALEQQDKIIRILDDHDLESWEILEKIKEVVKACQKKR